MFRYRFLPVLLLAAALAAIPAQDRDGASFGDAAAAEKYADWAQGAINRDQWLLAEEALERAADYADVSSDLSYLLALTRIRLDRPRRAVLETLHKALAFNQWNRYSGAKARLLLAETLVAIQSYEEALASLELAEAGEQEISLRALAYRGLRDSRRFIQTIREALDRYPRSTRPVRILFTYAADRIPAAEERELISLCLRRLPFLLDTDPELAFLAIPFIRDTEEARRLVAAYRADGGTNPAALPAALNLGVIDENLATEELFQNPVLDKNLIETVWGLLRSDGGRRSFADSLSRFSGTITEDIDRDGWSESRTSYRDGTISGYSYDADQDLLPELEVFFSFGIPTQAELTASDADSSVRVYVKWEQYPAILQAELEGVRYIPRPGEFLFKPLELRDLLGSALLYPERVFSKRISRRTLVSLALTIERPGREIPESLERIEMNRGVPQRSRVYLQDRLIADTEYLLGQPLLQRIDMDLDGRLETIRRFNQGESLQGDATNLASSESDWDGDGIYEYGERYLEDTVIRSWDMDGDGIREYTETGVRDW
jgi:hypothetical protein